MMVPGKTHHANSLPSLGNQCRFSPHGQNLFHGPASVFSMSAVKGVLSEFGLLARNLEYLSAFLYTMR